MENRMKIGTPADKPVHNSAATERKPNGEAPSSAGAAATDASAKVLLSDAVSSLLAGNEPVTGEFDKAKVERIADAIAQGKFVVNHTAIADKLIANAQELLGKTSH
jgi:negative regulator of flagellin synthesis FlgM